MTSIPISSATKRSVTQFDIGRPKNSINAPHPLSTKQDQYMHLKQMGRKQMLANIYGIHAAFRQDMDELILRNAKQHLPISSGSGIAFGLDVLLGRDQTIEPCEYLHGIDPMQPTFKLNRFD